MPDADLTGPPLRNRQSTLRTLITTGQDGQQTARPVAIVHPPGAELPTTVSHDAGQCGCQR